MTARTLALEALRQLDRWGVAQLRKALAPQPTQINAADKAAA